MAAPSRCDHCAEPVAPGTPYCPRCGAVLSWLTPTADAPPRVKAFLLVHIPRAGVKKSLLLTPVVRVGRGKGCDVVVPHPRVSRLHAILELRGGAWLVSDARSSGGTFLRDRPVTGPVPLRSGDTIRLGRNLEDCVTVVYHEGE